MPIKHEAFKRYRMQGSPDIDAHRSDDRLPIFQLLLDCVKGAFLEQMVSMI
jgi:hypothetical protein